MSTYQRTALKRVHVEEILSSSDKEFTGAQRELLEEFAKMDGISVTITRVAELLRLPKPKERKGKIAPSLNLLKRELRALNNILGSPKDASRVRISATSPNNTFYMIYRLKRSKIVKKQLKASGKGGSKGSAATPSVADMEDVEEVRASVERGLKNCLWLGCVMRCEKESPKGPLCKFERGLLAVGGDPEKVRNLVKAMLQEYADEDAHFAALEQQKAG